jgi:hypothetical protein
LDVGVGFDGVEVTPFVEDEDENDEVGSAPPAPQPAIPRMASRTTASLQVALRLTPKLPPKSAEADAKVQVR